jgi:diguanylate cyclase (GGDEF)-like protein
MRAVLRETYLRGRLARRLLAVFVLTSVAPVLLTSFLGYRQLVHGADAARARALHDEARESALTFLSELQEAAAELALVNPVGRASGGSDTALPPPLAAVSFMPVGTREQWLRALAAIPERMRAPLSSGQPVLLWSGPGAGHPQLFLIRLQRSRARLARATLDTQRMLDQVGPADSAIGIALLDSTTASQVLRSDRDPVPLGTFQQMAAESRGGAVTTLWHSRDGRWRGSVWDLFLQSSFAAPPIRVLICEPATGSIAGLPGLRLTIPIMLLGTMAFAAWLAIAQLRRYLGPLETLTAATRQLGASNFDVEVRIRTDDELSDLGDDFNRMARSLRDQHHELQRRAHVDGLTGLSNRDFFRQQLRERLSSGESSALLYIDLDEFKKVNDSAGHEAGDALLIQVAARLRACVQHSAAVARLGGDEFAVLLAGRAQADDAAAAATRVLQAVETPILVAGAERRVSASIGIALIPTDGSTVDLLLRNADIAMYQAKERGRNGMAFFSTEMHRRMEKRISLEIALQDAVARGELRLHYQPITSAGKLSGLEALVRWARPGGPETAPAEFIPIAEQSGLILAIGDWVLEQACADFAGWRDRGIAPGYVSVNVSPRQLRWSGFHGKLERLLRERRLEPRMVQLEVTEGALADGPEVAATLRVLHDAGVRLALDDFGTGYSSLSQLQRLPFDVVKIDRSFIVGLPESEIALQLVRTILRMTESLEKEAVAEGVETEVQRDLLQRLGCGSMQGYLFGKPVSEEQIRGLLQAAASPTETLPGSEPRGGASPRRLRLGGVT